MAKTKEEKATYMKEWRARNKEHISEYNRVYASENKESIAKKDARWRANNKDRVRKHNATYKSAHRDILAEKQRQYYYNNHDARLECMRSYRENNSEKISSAQKIAWENGGREKRAVIIAERLAFIGRYKTMFGCERCGYNEDPVALDLHHIDPKSKSVRQLQNHPLETIKLEIKKCSILCANCHRIHHFSKQEY